MERQQREECPSYSIAFFMRPELQVSGKDSNRNECVLLSFFLYVCIYMSHIGPHKGSSDAIFGCLRGSKASACTPSVLIVCRAFLLCSFFNFHAGSKGRRMLIRCGSKFAPGTFRFLEICALI